MALYTYTGSNNNLVLLAQKSLIYKLILDNNILRAKSSFMVQKWLEKDAKIT